MIAEFGGTIITITAMITKVKVGYLYSDNSCWTSNTATLVNNFFFRK